MQRQSEHHSWHSCIYVCDITNSCVTWVIHTWLTEHHAETSAWYDSFMCDLIHSYVTWPMHIWHGTFTRDMTPSHMTWFLYMSNDSFTCVSECSGAPCRDTDAYIYIWDMANSCVIWLLNMWHASFYMWIDSFICVSGSRGASCRDKYAYICVTWLIHVWYDYCIRDMIPFICETTHSCVSGLQGGEDL